MASTREAYGKALVELGQEKDNVIVLDADLTKSTKTIDFKKAFSDRHFNLGIAEANMMGVAAGLASSGKVVYASSFAMFAAGRAFEVIRNSICYPSLNVKVCATHAGISVGEDGASHQAIEDIAIMRAIPNMKVFVPSDEFETRAIIKAVYDISGPCYVRMGRSNVEAVFDENYKYQFGKGIVLKTGVKLAIIATGLMVQKALKVSTMLKNYDPTIVNINTIKPIDEELLVDLAKHHDIIVSLEEHSIIGGLGSAISECLAPYGLTCKHYSLGMRDVFGRSGKPKDLFKYYGLDEESIAKYIDELK